MIELLHNDILHNRVAHSYLLLGTTAAEQATQFAAALVCPTPRHSLACGVCERCRRVQAGAYSDIIHLQPEGAFYKVEQIRDLIREASLSPREGDRRIFLLEQADQMRDEAANALLKTLEEPVGGTVFLLCAVNRDRILPTIESRCRVLRCEQPETETGELDEIAAALHQITTANRRETLRFAENLSKDNEKMAAFFNGVAQILYANERGLNNHGLTVSDPAARMELWQKAMRVPMLLEHKVNTRLIADDFLLALRRIYGG